jgi:Ca2+-binding EF-hand superfamily protein
MKVSRNITFTVVSAIVLAVGSVPALAQQTQGHHGGKPDAASGMMGDQDGMMGMMAMMMGGAMREAMAGFDTDGDGTTSPEEMTAGVETALKTYDTDASGSLSLDEFAALHAAMMRPMTVRMFQMHDSDGDAAVTKAEMAKMAAMMQGMMAGSQDGMSDMGTGMSDDN